LLASVSTVHEYLKRAEATNISWPLPDAWDDARVEAVLFQEPESRRKQKKSSPDFAAVHEQLRQHRHVTLQLLLAGISGRESGWLPLLALLRTLSALAEEAGCRDAAGAQGRRKGLHRLGRCDYPSA
jgi:hypothetical protein